jgi:hypothetical protein
VSCVVTKPKKPKVKCTVTYADTRAAGKRLRWRVTRANQTIARGTETARRKQTPIRLGKRELDSGRYVFTVSYSADGKRVTARTLIDLR